MSSLSEGIYEWDVEQFTAWLREQHLHDCVKPFSLKKINGRKFLNLSDSDIKSFRISQESERKLLRVLQKIKGKRKTVLKRFDKGAETKDRRKPPSISLDDQEGDSDSDGWATDDFADESDDEPEAESDDSGGDYIEPEADPPSGSPSKEVPNIQRGLVAQLRAGLAGSINRNSTLGNQAPQWPGQSLQPASEEVEECDEIYDEPPNELEEFYEQPSDDSGGGIVIRPMSNQKVIRCPSERGEYIDARPPKYSIKDDEDVVACPPRPPKPGRAPAPPVTEEFYEVCVEDGQPGAIVEDEYEVAGNDCIEEETYEVADESSQNNNQPEMYEIPGQEQDTYEIPGQEEETEDYEMPDPTPALPIKPSQPKRLSGFLFGQKPPKPSLPSKKETPKPLGRGGAAPPSNTRPSLPANKPQISPKQRAPMPVPGKEPSRPLPKPDIRGPRPLSHVPNIPIKSDNEVPTSPTRTQPGNRRPLPTPGDEPPPPRPGPKPGAVSPPSRSNKNDRLPPKPPRTSDSDNQEDDPVIPLNQLMRTKRAPLPAPPEPKKDSVDGMKNAPWFQGPLDKKTAEFSLKSFRKDGAFIVRNSSRDPNNFSMSLYYNGSVRHLSIPRNGEKKFVLGDSGKMQFDTIVELVDHYSQHHVELKSGGSTHLTVPCPLKK